MAIIIDVPGIAAAGVDWPIIPSVPATLPLDGLISYLAVQGAAINPDGRIDALNQFVGADALVRSSAPNAPIVETVSGIDWVRTAIARLDRLIPPPGPIGGAWDYGDAAGLSVSFPVEMLDLTTESQGLITIGGFRVRFRVGVLQIQKTIAGGGTQTITPSFNWDDPCIVGLTYDVASNTCRVYRNGVQVVQSVSANWGAITSELPVYGSTFNGSFPSEARLGDLIRHNRELTAAEMLAVSDYLRDRFGIA